VEESNIIAVELIDKGQALALFKIKLRKQSDKIDITKLAVALKFIPLTIV